MSDDIKLEKILTGEYRKEKKLIEEAHSKFMGIVHPQAMGYTSNAGRGGGRPSKKAQNPRSSGLISNKGSSGQNTTQNKMQSMINHMAKNKDAFAQNVKKEGTRKQLINQLKENIEQWKEQIEKAEEVVKNLEQLDS